jgi:lipopolysaccharide/colanic/teichoic acid biosynthesis glycosyltransferase
MELAAARGEARPADRIARRKVTRLHRAAEIGLAALLLILASPILLFAVAAVLVFSGWPVFYGHVRVGRDGRPFRCWKLRTMMTDAESRLNRDADLRDRYVSNGYKLSEDDDPRVTKIGRLIRRAFIDELPQLINVLNGTMSLVGPRPVIEEELQEFDPHARELLALRPGIVGAWTSHGRNRPSYPERAQIEIEYVRNRSLRTDASILFRSLPVVLRGQRPGS